MTLPATHMEQFLLAKEAAGLSPRTLEWYRDQIAVYLAWLPCALDWDQPATVEAYLAAQRRLALSPSTVAARYRALSVWFGWLLRRGEIAASPIRAVDRPKVPKVLVEHVRLSHFRRLYASIGNSPSSGLGTGEVWIDLRDRCLLLLLFWSGLRVSETLRLCLRDVDPAARLVTVRGGKGGKDRIVPCAPELGPEMLGYLMARPPWTGTELFLSNDGAGGVRGLMTASGVRQMLRRRSALAGVPYMSPHKHRHGFAMLFLNAGMPMSALAEAMGHSSEQVTANFYASWLTEGPSRQYEAARRRVLGGPSR